MNFQINSIFYSISSIKHFIETNNAYFTAEPLLETAKDIYKLINKKEPRKSIVLGMHEINLPSTAQENEWLDKLEESCRKEDKYLEFCTQLDFTISLSIINKLEQALQSFISQ